MLRLNINCWTKNIAQETAALTLHRGDLFSSLASHDPLNTEPGVALKACDLKIKSIKTSCLAT